MDQNTSIAKQDQSQSMQLASFEQIATQVKAIEKCIVSLMKVNLHYGTIPGCGDKKTLKKPGAEMLSKLFQIRPEYKHDRNDLGNGHFEIVSHCTMYSHTSGAKVGEGSGSCSTMESKYRWRKGERKCPKCDGNILRSRFAPREDIDAQPGWYCKDCKTQYSYGDPDIRGQKTDKIENPDIADQYNTVLKMADKRAYVAAVITTTGASDYVTQDINDDDDVPTTATEDNGQNIQDQAEQKPAKIRIEYVSEAEKIISDSADFVTKWAIETGKIKQGQTWKDMEIHHINSIILSGKGFITMINNYFDSKIKK